MSFVTVPYCPVKYDISSCACNYKAVKGRNDEWIIRVMYTHRGQREESPEKERT